MTPALRGVVGRAQNPKRCPQPQAHNPRNVPHDEGNLQTKFRSRDWEIMVAYMGDMVGDLEIMVGNVLG